MGAQEPAPNPDNLPSEGPILPRWALWLMLPGIAGPVLIFIFIAITESAHDPADCPYARVQQRELAADVAVREEARNCIGDIEERRFTVVRGETLRLLGRRRFPQSDFAAEGYGWDAVVSDDGEVQVTVQVPGHDDVLFREGTAEEREKGISY
jgi:hypothetical protein